MQKILKILAGLAIVLSLYSIYLTRPYLLESVPYFGEQTLFEKGRLNLDTAQVETIFAEIAEKVIPAVVNVKGESVSKKSLMDYLPNWSRFFTEWLNLKAFKPKKRKRLFLKSQGSGFIINRNGYVVTNYHVIEDADQIIITFFNNKKQNAELIGADPDTDLALLRVNTSESLPVLFLGNSQTLKVGEWVMAIGNPLGLSHSVTVGIVSGTGRSVGIAAYEDFIQTDAYINYGNSGGPLLNIKGEVIGMNTAIIPNGEGIGFAIPANTIRNVIDGIPRKNWITRISPRSLDLGSRILTLDSELQNRN